MCEGAFLREAHKLTRTLNYHEVHAPHEYRSQRIGITQYFYLLMKSVYFLLLTLCCLFRHLDKTGGNSSEVCDFSPRLHYSTTTLHVHKLESIYADLGWQKKYAVQLLQGSPVVVP